MAPATAMTPIDTIIFGDESGMVPEFHRMAREAGRDPASLEVTLMGPTSDVDKLKRLAETGVSRAVAMLPSDSRDKTMAAIDRWTKIMQQVNA